MKSKAKGTMTKLRSGRRTATSGGGGGGDGAGAASKKKQPAKKKRSAEEHPDTKVLKKAKPSVCKAAEELVCPILQGLPIDPVIAEDGQIYERKEIEKYLEEKKDEDEILSPVTKQPFETKVLIPSVHVRNVIEHLIGSGIIEGEIADTWKERNAEKRESEEKIRRMKELLEATKKRAENGDADEMYQLGVWYDNGFNGVEVDVVEAHKWYKRAAEGGNVMGMALAGCWQMYGSEGTEKNEMEGLILVATAASQGSDHACHTMGEVYYNGLLGVTKNMSLAQHWLEKAVSIECAYQHAHDEDIQKARIWLQEIVEAKKTKDDNRDGSDE